MKKIMIYTLMGIMIILSGCSGGSDKSAPEITTKTITFSGLAVDGYISGAVACLDLNINGNCDSDEPTTTTTVDGTFNFTNIEVPKNSFLPVIVTGGTDMATNKPFAGELKSIVDSDTVTSGVPITVTPLSDIIAVSFLKSSTKNATALNNSKIEVAQTFGLDVSQVDSDPMTNPAVFAKVQELQYTKVLLESIALKAKGSPITQSDEKEIQDQIKDAIASQTKGSSNTVLDLNQILSDLEETIGISIPENEKGFVNNQIITLRDTLADLTQLDTNLEQLNALQTALENSQSEASAKIQNSTGNAPIPGITIGNLATLIEQGSSTDTATKEVIQQAVIFRSVDLGQSSTVDALINATCESRGGAAIYSGFDTNKNGLLDTSEQFDTPQILCNGKDVDTSVGGLHINMQNLRTTAFPESFYLGDTKRITLSNIAEDGTITLVDVNVTWTISDDTILEFTKDSFGINAIKGIKEGIAIVTASYNGESIQQQVQVLKGKYVLSSANIKIDQSIELPLYQIYADGNTINYDDYNASLVTSSDESIINFISGPNFDNYPIILNGSLKAESVGTAIITITIDDETLTQEMTVVGYSNDFSLNLVNTLEADSLFVGESGSTRVNGTYTDGSEAYIQGYTLSSSDESVARAGYYNSLTALKEGNITLTTIVNGATLTKIIEVVTVTNLTLERDSRTLFPASITDLQLYAINSSGIEKTINREFITWNSSDESVATISSGRVSTKKSGTVTISATYGTTTATLDITVNPFNSIRFVSKDSMPLGDYIHVSVYGVTDFNNNHYIDKDMVTLSILDGDILEFLSYDSSRLHSLKIGTTTITATLDGNSISQTITVLPPSLTYLYFNITSATLLQGSSKFLTVTGIYSNGSSNKILANQVTWSVSDSSIATVDVDGKLTALVGGTVSVTATVGTIHTSQNITVEPVREFHVTDTTSLRAAFEDSAFTSMANRIYLADGTYSTQTDNGGTFTYFNDTQNIEIIGSSQAGTILTASNKGRVLKSNTSGITMYLKNLTVMDGNITTGNGAGVYSASTLELDNVLITNNMIENSGKGAGVYASSLYIDNSMISYNTIKNIGNDYGMGGAGVYASSLNMDNSTISYNILKGRGYGAGIYADYSDITSSYIGDNTIDGNSTNAYYSTVKGAGIYGYGNLKSSTIHNNRIINVKSRSYGAGLSGSFSIYDSNITNNSIDSTSTTNEGAGGYGIRSITNTIFANNTLNSGQGGAISTSSIDVKNSLFYDNNATSAGALKITTKSTIINSIFVGNPNALVNNSSNNFNIFNTLFYDNANYDINGTIESVTLINYSYLDEGKVLSPNLVNNSINSGDLGFVDILNRDFHLSGTSVLIDAGTSVSSGITAPLFDLQNNDRPSGAAVDIGVYEYQY